MVEKLGFGMPFENRAIHHSNSIQPFKIRMGLVFERPLYLVRNHGAKEGSIKIRLKTPGYNLELYFWWLGGRAVVR